MSTSDSAPQPRTRAEYRARAVELTEMANQCFTEEVKSRFESLRERTYGDVTPAHVKTMAGLAALAQANALLAQDPNIPER